MGLEFLILQSLKNGPEEATHNELGSLLGGDSAGHHVEEFVLIQFAGRRAVRAANIIS